jgi:hypothetical protein
MPAGAVGDDCRMDLGSELSVDFIEVQLHHGSIGAGQNQADGTVALRTEGAKDISNLITGVDGHRRTSAFG